MQTFCIMLPGWIFSRPPFGIRQFVRLSLRMTICLIFSIPKLSVSCVQGLNFLVFFSSHFGMFLVSIIVLFLLARSVAVASPGSRRSSYNAHFLILKLLEAFCPLFQNVPRVLSMSVIL